MRCLLDVSKKKKENYKYDFSDVYVLCLFIDANGHDALKGKAVGKCVE